MEKIQACVNPRLLAKAQRLFTGTRDGRIIELLQNARRAGATAWLAGAIVAVVEAVTWAILGGFGPQPTLPNASAVEKVFVVLIAIPIGAAAGAIGGRVGARRGTAGGVAA